MAEGVDYIFQFQFLIGGYWFSLSFVRGFLKLNGNSNAPINILPHLPHAGKRGVNQGIIQKFCPQVGEFQLLIQNYFST